MAETQGSEKLGRSEDTKTPHETASNVDLDLGSLVPRFFGTDDMPEEMRKVAVEVARVALTKRTNRDRAEHIKKHFDKTYSTTTSGGKWHCVVGTDFGSYVTHEAQNFLFFQLGPYFVLIFKA
jgi:dynein light chain LC8-type